MCQDCYESYGSPVDVTPETKETVKAIRELYGYAAAGGGAHVVTDDWNLDDEDIDFCLNNQDGEYLRDKPEEAKVTLKVLTLLRTMTESQRATVLGIRDGFIKPEEQ